MEDKNKIIGVVQASDANPPLPSPYGDTAGDSFDPQALSVNPTETSPNNILSQDFRPRSRSWLKLGALAAVALLFFGGTGFVLTNSQKRGGTGVAGGNAAAHFGTTVVPLDDIRVDPIVSLTNTKTVTINGTLTVKEGLIVAPSIQPANAQAGQIYYDINDNTLAYFNGTSFVSVGGNVVKDINTLTGNIPLGAGLADIGGQLVNTGVLSVQGLNGNVTLTAGQGIAINGTTIANDGVISVVSSSPALTVTDDGNGNLTLDLSASSGTGTVTSTGGNVGRIAKFTAAQNIEDSLLSESGATITVNGNLAVTGSVTLSTPLSVSNGGTGAASLNANGILVGNGTSAFTSVVAGGAGFCLVSTAGAPVWGNCNPPSTTVNSVNGLSGALTIANATGLVDTITIDDASTSNKGIVQFDGTNFSVSNGVANTTQNISTSSSPTFSSLTLTGDIAVNGGDITSTGALNVTPAGALTAGSATQALTLQGNSSTVFTATNGANTTTVSFQAPTANVTYRFATATAGSYDICTSAGNCGAGGTITGSGTAGTLPKFTGASAIGDSLIGEVGSTITINGNLSLAVGNQFQINGTQISSANLSNDSNLAKLNASQTFTGNNVAFQNGSNSATAFAVQNAAGNRIATVDTTGGELQLGQGSTIGGRLVFNNATNNNTVTLVSAVVTGNRTITLPDDSGTICLSSGNCAGVGATLQTSYNNSTDPEIVVDSTRGAVTIRDNSVPIAANLLEVQDNAGGTTFFAVSATGTSITQGLTVTGTTNINTSGTAATGVGNSTGALTFTGSSGSTFVLNGSTVDATEFNRLDGKDAALVDTNDGVNTAITGTGALNTGSITSGFGSIDTGADNITTTGILQGTTSVLTQSLDRTSAGALNIGASTATSIVLGQNTSLTGAATFTSGTGTVLLQGNTDVAASVSLATRRGATYTTAGSANDVALNVASLYILDTSGAAQTITGIAAGRDGQLLTLVNGDAALAVTISNNSGSSSAANRITTGIGSDVTLAAGGSITLVYDTNANLWRVVGSVAGGGGTCATCANQQLSNLSSTNLNTALNVTAGNLDLTTTTSGNIVLNSAGTIELQDNTNVTGTLGVSSTLTVTAGGASIAGNTTIASTAGNTLGLGNSTGAVTVTGSSGSTFVLDGVTVTTAEFNLLDGHDAALVDTNDAVNTAITGTGALGSGSITSGFGSIDTGADNITTTGTLQGTTNVLTQSLDRTSAGALNIGASTATSIVLGQNTSLTGAATFTSGTGTVLLQGNTDIANTVSFATRRGATYTTAGSANDVAINVASLYVLDTSGAAQTITGIAAGRDGQYLTLVNGDASLAVTLSNNSGSSTAANRISTGTGSDVSLAAGASVTLVYDTASNLWRVVGGVAGGVGTCGTCANQQLSNLVSTSINTALNATSTNLDLTTTTSGNIVLNSAGTIELQDNTNVTGTLGVSSTLTVTAGGASIAGNTTIASTAGNTLGLGNSTGTLTVTGSSSSTFVMNGVTVDATEFNRLDGKDAALVDTNDAVNTAITGTGVLGTGSIASGFGSIDTGADNITTTGTLQGTTSILTQSLDRTSAGALNIGASTATSIVLGQNTSLTGASTFTSGTGLVLLQGNTDVAATVSFATRAGTTYTTAGSANDVALNVASLYILDTSGAAQTITGIAAGRDGQHLTLVNADPAQAVTLSNNSGSSSAANRITTGTGADISIPIGGSVSLIYDSTSSLWRVTSGVAGGSGTCSGCANTALSNLAGVNINTALNTTSANLDLTTTTSGNIVLNAAGTIELQDNTNITGTLGVSSTLTVSAGGASIAGNTTIASTAGNTLGLGNSTGAVTVTGSSSSTFVLDGVTVTTAEFNLLDGHDAALVDTNDSVNTAITGTGALNAGSITSGFGSIDTGGDNITTTGTLQGTTAVLTQSLDRTSAGALNIGASTATSIVLGQNTSLTGAATFTSGTGTVLLQGNTDVAASVSFATKAGATYTTAGSADDVALNVASLYILDTSGAAQTITGIAAGRDGQHLTLVNADATQAVTLSNNNGSSLAANRITTGTGADIAIPIGGSVSLIYDSTSSLWRVASGVAGGVGTCSGCANTALSNLSGVNINTALNTTSANLDLTTTTSGNIVLNSAGTIELQDNTNVTGTLGVSSTLTVTAGGLTVTAGGASIAGNTTIASTAGNTLGLGNSTGAVTVTGSSGSTFVINGVTVDATEFNRLDGKDAALVDTNDAVNTAITGTGALGAGSITSGFGSIDTGADNITTTGTLQGTTSVLTQSLDRTTAGALNIGASTATSIVLGQNTSLTGAATFTSGTGTVLLQGNTDVAATVSLATRRGTTYTTAGSANDVALNAASLYLLDTSGAAQTITGIAAGRDGQHLTLVNADATLAVTLSNNSGSSSAANRITTGTGADVSVAAGSSIDLVYDSASSLWRVVGGVAGGNGTCSGCANTALSNLASVNINTALNATSANLNLTTTTSGNIVLNSAGTIELQDNTNVTGTLGVSSTLTVTAGGASIAGNTTIASTAGNTLGLGNSTGTLTVTGSSSSTFVINGITVDATEFNRLDGKDAALVDTNDAVNTAITGTGALGAGSITSGFGSIDTGADNITTTGTLQGTTSVLTQSLDRTSAGALNIGSTTATSIVLGQNTSLTGAATFTSGTGLVLLQGNTDVAASVSLATRRGATYTTAGSANDVALNVASLYILDTSGAAQTITGIVAGRDGQYLALVNGDASLAVTLSNNSGSSSAANRITTGTGADISIPAGGSVNLVYDTAASLWRVVGGVAGGICSSCANQQLSNLSSTNINAALNATSANLNLTTTTSGNIVLNSAGTIELQDNTNVAGTNTFTVGTGLTTLGGGLTASGGAIQLNVSGTANTSIGNASGTFALISSGGLNVTTGGALSGISTISTSSTINSQTISSAANFTGTVTVANDLTLTAGDINVNGGDILSTGALNITPTGTLTAGSTNQTLTLQGAAGTTLSATNGANTTTVGFTTPTANTTLNFPALTAGTYNICTSSGNCAGAGVTLQVAYDNSTNPELVLGSASTAGITIRDNSSAIAGNLLEVQNNGASTTYFAVTSAGIQTTGTNTSSGNVNTTGGTIQTNNADRIDNSGNLVNIGNLTATGAITIASAGATNDVIVDGADQFIVQDAAVFNGTVAMTSLGSADTAAYLCRNSSNQVATCNTAGAGAAFVQGGNTFGATATLGTNDSNGLDIRTDSTTRLSVGAAGGVLIQGNATADELEIGDDIFNLNDANSRINVGSTANDSYIRLGESSSVFGFVGWQNSINTLRVGTFGAHDIRLETNSATRMTLTGAGAVNLDTAAANGVAGFSVATTQTNATGLQPANTLAATFNPGGTASASYFANQLTASIGTAGTTFTGDIVANLGQVNWSGATNTSNTGKLYGTVGKVVTAAGAGSVQNAVALFSQLQYAGGTTVTNSYDVYASNLQSGATTNLFGFYAENLTGGTNNYPLYLASATANQPLLSVNGTGATTFQNSTNSASAFQIQNTLGQSALSVDTTTPNLITNPSIETNTTGWNAKGSATISRITTQSYAGNASLQAATTAAAGDGATFTYSLASSTEYSFSVFVKTDVPAVFGNALEIGRSENGSADTSCSTNQALFSTYWARYTCTFTTGTVSGSPYLYVKQIDTNARNLWIDGVQLETAASATRYLDGKTSIGSLAVNANTSMVSSSTATLYVQAASGGEGVLFRGNGDGNVFRNMFQTTTADGTTIFSVNDTSKGTFVQGGNGFFGTAALYVLSTDSTARAFDVRGAAGQSTDIMRVTDSAANKLVTVGATSGSLFAAKVDYATASSSPQVVVSADLDKDGDVDMAVTNGSATSVSIFLNNGNGTFATKVDYAAGTTPVGIIASDLDKDGDIDLAVANNTDSTVSIFLNNGNGTFATKVDYAAGTNPSRVTSADLDKDGDIDLAVTNYTDSTVSIFLNNGNGTFATKVDYAAGTNPRGVTAGDLDKDGDIDLAVANYGATSMSVFLNNGNGTFAAKVDYTTGTNPWDITSADLDKDGDIDLAVANYGATSMSVFLNTGAGAFATKVDYITGTNPRGVTAGDYDKDGDIDLAVTNGGSATVSIFLNNGAGTFATKIDYTTGTTPDGVTSADFSKDGNLDLAVANNGSTSASVFLNNTLGVSPVATPTLSLYTAGVNDAFQIKTVDDKQVFKVDARGNTTIGNPAASAISSSANLFAAMKDYATNDAPNGVAYADFDKDGDMDIVVANQSSSNVSVFMNNGNGTFATKADYSAGSQPYAIVAVDLEKDGDIDIAVTNRIGNTVTILLNTGSGSNFTNPTSPATNTNPQGIAAGDFDKDGDIDLAVSNFGADTIRILTNDGDGTSFTNASNPPVGDGPQGIVSGDFDKDGDIDLVVGNANASANTVSVLLNTGSGAFAAAVGYTTGTNPRYLAAADFDKDGDIDIAATNNGSDTVSILMNNGNGTLAAKVDYTAGDSPESIAAADFDKDGDIDLVAANSLSTAALAFFSNNGNGTFATKVDYATGSGSNPVTPVAADLDFDGDLDVAVSNWGVDTIGIFRNTTYSESTFKVLNGAGVPNFSVDTTNSRVHIGNPEADGIGALLVLDTKNTSSDPIGTNGAMYYNSFYGRFRCYQNNVWVDCIAGSPREYLRAESTAVQNGTDIDNTADHLKFASVIGSAGGSISLDTASAYAQGGAGASVGRFTLAAGKTYSLRAGVPWASFGTDGALNYRWYNVTAGSVIGTSGGVTSPTYSASNVNATHHAEAIITPAVTTMVEVRLVDVSAVTAVGATTNNLLPNAYIEVLSDGGAGGASAAEYMRAEMATQQTTNVAAADHIKLDSVAASSGSSISLSTAAYPSVGRMTLAAGKTYRLTGQTGGIGLSASSCWALFQWYNVTSSSYIGSSTYSVPAANPSNDVGNTITEGVITTSVATTVEMRIRSVAGGCTISAIDYAPDGRKSYAFVEVLSDGTKIAQFQGATASVDGQSGYVPKPIAGQQGSLLLGDGTWSTGVTVLSSSLGIGIASPTSKLHVYEGTTGGTSLATFRDNPNAALIEIISTGDNTSFLRSGGGDSLNFAANASSTAHLSISSSTGNITVGTSDTTGALFVLDVKTGSGDPGSPVVGAMYYNSNAGRFRCYQVNEWRDCVSSVTTSGISGAFGGTTNITSTTYVNMPATSSVSFTKKAASTKLVVNLNVTGYSTSGAPLVSLAINVDSTDYNCGTMIINNTLEHHQMTCSVVIPSLAAGSKTVQGRWRVSSSTTLTVDTGDWLSMTVQETD